MKLKFIICILLLIPFLSIGQQLTYKSRGRIFNSQNERLSPSEVRELLKTKPGMLQLYNDGRMKKTVGNVLIVGGIALIAGDFVAKVYESINNPRPYPSLMTFAGVAAIAVAIPVKIGFSKKIHAVVDDYNKELVSTDPEFQIEKLSLLANENGLGIQITF